MAAEKRASWGSQVEFFLTCVGGAVGLGNVWRYPYLAYKDGGGAFLLPYFLCLFAIGIPLFGLDINLGQFASLGPMLIWRFSPAFKGLGISMVVVSATILIYYSVVIAQFLYFLFASMTSELPWSTCLHEWNTCACRLRVNDTSYLNNTFINCTGIQTVNHTTPSEEFYNNKVLEASDGIGSPGKLKWELVLCNLLSWTVCCIIIIKGIKSLGKAIYVFVILPYILLTVMLVRGLTLDGHKEGISFYITPRPEILTDASVWGDAAVQIIYSTGTCTGGLIAMASYNKFHHNAIRDSILVPLINCLTSFFAGFAIFSVLGFMANEKGVDIKDVTEQGPGLTFVLYPEAIAHMPIPTLWAILFFIMLVTLGWSSMIAGVEAVMTAIQDVVPSLTRPRNNYIFRIASCFLGFLLGLPQVTQGGSYLLKLMDTFLGGFPLLILGLFEVVAVMYVYGIFRFKKDIEMMLAPMNVVNKCLFYYFLVCWGILSPLILCAVILFKCIQYKPITGPNFPEWSEVMGWLTVTASLLPFPVWYIGSFFYNGGFRFIQNRLWGSLFEVWKDMHRPSSNWGPMQDENKCGRYSFGLHYPLSQDCGNSIDNSTVAVIDNEIGVSNPGYRPEDGNMSEV